MAQIVVDAANTGKTCPYCRFPLKGGIAAVACDSCGTVHHQECWDEGGGCSVFGCRKESTAAPASPPVPAVQRPSPPPAPLEQRPAAYVEREPASPSHPARRRRLLIAVAVVAGLLVAGGSAAAVVLLTGSNPAPAPAEVTPPPAKANGFDGRIAGVVRPLVGPQRRVSTLVAATEPSVAAFTRLRDAASVLQEAVFRAQGAAGVVSARGTAERAGKAALQTALTRQAAYALSLAELPAPTGFSVAEAQSISARATTTQTAYGALLREVPSPCCVAMPITGTTQLISVANTVASTPSAPTPTPTPATTPPSSTGTPGVAFDFVADSGGVGVRYRYSPSMTDLVPGNGPFQGDRVTIYCYTTGDTVRGNDYWAKVAVSPDYYVPATYLRYGHLGPPAGVPSCGSVAPVTNGTPGVNFDIVAFSGGVGVRYRYSPKMSNLVPGNGPFEGDRVPIYCYTTGQTVRGNDYWAKIAVGPDRYVPATYLQYGHLGAPNGVTFC